MEEFQKFKDAITPFLPTWKVLEIRAIADLDARVLLSMVACFSPDDPKPIEITEPLQGIVFIRETLPISNINSMLAEWEKGTITFGSQAVSISEFANIRFSGLTSGNEDLTLGWTDFRIYRQFSLHSYANKNLEAIAQKNDMWAIAKILGFMGFDELSLNRVQFRVGSSYTPKVEIFAPVFAVVEAKTQTDELHLRIRTHQALQSEDLSLSYRIQDRKGDRLSGGKIPVNEFKMTTLSYFNILDYSMPLPDKSVSGEVLLYHKLHKSQGEPISTAFFTVQPAAGATNPRWDFVLSIVTNTRKWNKVGITPEEVVKQWLGLSQPRPQDDDFELGVSALFFASGIAFLPMGPAEGVDHLVLSTEPQQTAAVISCTTSADIGKKISDLMTQRNRAQDRLPKFSVRAAIVAPVDKGDLRLGDINDCEAHDITLVLRSDLQTIFDQVRGINWGEAPNTTLQIVTHLSQGTIHAPTRL